MGRPRERGGVHGPPLLGEPECPGGGGAVFWAWGVVAEQCRGLELFSEEGQGVRVRRRESARTRLNDFLFPARAFRIQKRCVFRVLFVLENVRCAYVQVLCYTVRCFLW